MTPTGTLLGSRVVPSGTGTHADEEVLRSLRQDCQLPPEDCCCLVATGYGRLICKEADMQMSEISCHAKGIHYLIPETRTIIDIGGQDLKVIRISERGSVQQFIMNDKCAAGTGRFLEVMANVLGLRPEDLCELARQGGGVSISSMCTVFAESEVISLIGKGEKKENIAFAVVDSIVKKVASQASRLEGGGPVCLTGGLCESAYIRQALERQLRTPVQAVAEGRYAGAVGAALCARELAKKG